MQSSEEIEKLWRDFAGIHMEDDEIKDLCRGAWKNEKYNYLYFDGTYKNNSKYGICNENISWM